MRGWREGERQYVYSMINISHGFDRNVWKIFLEQGQYEKAKRYAEVRSHLLQYCLEIISMGWL